jgi:hypothetical protein
MLAAAPQQSGQAVHRLLPSPRPLHWCASSHCYSPYPSQSDRGCAIFYQELHRCISSSSLTDPPSVFF